MSHHGQRGYPKTKQIRSELRKQAEADLAEYNKLSLEEKLARLPIGGAKKQRARLLALLEKQNKPKEAVPVTQPSQEKSLPKEEKKLLKKYMRN